MSPVGADKSTAAIFPHAAGQSVAPRRNANAISEKDRGGVEVAPETGNPPFRPVASARVASPRTSDPHSFNDPCNYLG
jgi:hypothetical protein